MKYIIPNLKRAAKLVCLAVLPLGLAGCPATDENLLQYDLGFVAGFAEDGEYWQGFDDSYDTVDAGPIYYTGSEIPYYTDPPYDAGYWDGVWYAYNDGYFVAYDYAFTVGFSEGYDVAFQPGYADFLQNDTHLEYLDGGFTDGYNDGFSEGRVFGAYDYANGLPFDWLDAILDYWSLVDLTVAGVSTGVEGPVLLYEYGTDPYDIIEGKSVKQARLRKGERSGIRQKQDGEGEGVSYRNLTAKVQGDFSVHPLTSPRANVKLRLQSTWLTRIEQYRDALDLETKSKHTRQ